ncbi:MAG: hypothetical protein HDR41_04285 [Lactobacillus sp.]|nr:hypothetical protein [Lactobacillus sp.]
MFKVEIDITNLFKRFSTAASDGDVDSAKMAISYIAARTLMTPQMVLEQILLAAKGKKIDDYRMATNLLQNYENKNQRKSDIFDEAIYEIKYCLKEIRRSNNSAIIRNYLNSIKKNLADIEATL